MESNDNIIKELQQDVKKDKILAFLIKYKYVIIFITLFMLLLGIVYSLFTYYKISKAKTNSLDFYHIQELISQSDPLVIDKINNLIKNGNKGYKFLSYLNLFNYYLSTNDSQNAILTLEKAYKDNLPVDYKDFIGYLLINFHLNLKSSLSNKDLTSYIKSHLIKSGSFYYINLELYLIHLLKINDYEEAERISKEILESSLASEEIKNRVNNLKSLINN